MTKMTTDLAKPQPHQKVAGGGPTSVRTAETLLRVAPMGLCLAALVLTLKNSVDNEYGSVSYSDLGSFKYLVYVNGLCAGYSILSAFYTAAPRSISKSSSWVLFSLDQVVTYAILAAVSAASEILYLSYKGDEEVTWSRACVIYAGFCHKATASIGVTFGAVVCYVLVSLISSYRLFTTYHAPNLPFSTSTAAAAAPEDDESAAAPPR
ncbi:hypothetical protein HPP92_012626 [Vanilla planifolia]|uniref:CASP-like protein n=1 Tax=Vanilla planifolia TaxID=51239 RepID=A0A835UXQ3_VANPL|nr:hypothetical protein HPP92_012626 [Vanilla planifolia]